MPGIDRVVGPTIATVPLIVSLDENQPFQDLVDSLEKKSLDMMQFAHFGLQNIRRLSTEAENLCNFQTIIIVQPDSDVTLPCGATRSIEESYDLSSFNTYGLMMEVLLGKEELTITANFDSTLFESNLMKRFLRQLGHILDQCQQNAALSLKDIEIATTEDHMEIAARQGPIAQVIEAGVHELVAAQIYAHGDKIAIDGWDGSVTYKELDKLSSN